MKRQITLFLLAAFGALAIMACTGPSDYKKPKGAGNTQSNLLNGGFIAEAEGMLYYRNIQDEGKLYRSKPDGSEAVKISDDQSISFINAFKEWIYYVDNTEGGGNRIVKIRPDGSERTVLNDRRSTNLHVFRNELGQFAVWYIDIDGGYKITSLIKNFKDQPFQFAVDNAYMFTFDMDNSHLYFATPEGVRYVGAAGLVMAGNTGRKFIKGKQCTQIIYHDGKIFYGEIAESGHYATLKSKGVSWNRTEKKYMALSSTDIALSGKYIIMTDDDRKTVWCMKINGKKPVDIATIPDMDSGYSTAINCIGETVYLMYHNGQGTAMTSFPLNPK